MIRRDHPELSLSRQCRLLSVSRSSLYHAPQGESAQNLELMRRIDELFLKYPFYGSRQMVRHLWREGVRVGRHRVRRLMRVMGLQAIYQAPRTTTRHPQHRVYPYLLKGLAIERPNQVWTADITYIPVQRGFLYLVAVMDWATGRVLSWRLSNTLGPVLHRRPHRRPGALRPASDLQYRPRQPVHLSNKVGPPQSVQSPRSAPAPPQDLPPQLRRYCGARPPAPTLRSQPPSPLFPVPPPQPLHLPQADPQPLRCLPLSQPPPQYLPYHLHSVHLSHAQPLSVL